MGPYLFRLREQAGSELLLTRDEGDATATRLRRFVADPGLLFLDFSGIDVATPSFLDALCAEIDLVLRRHRDEQMFVVATHMNSDVTDSMEYILERHRHSLAYFRGDEIDLLNASPHLVETLRVAIQLGGEFTVPELATALSVKPNAANQRLASLLEAGAVARQRDGQAERGVRYRYQTPPARLSDASRAVTA